MRRTWVTARAGAQGGGAQGGGAQGGGAQGGGAQGGGAQGGGGGGGGVRPRRGLWNPASGARIRDPAARRRGCRGGAAPAAGMPASRGRGPDPAAARAGRVHRVGRAEIALERGPERGGAPPRAVAINVNALYLYRA